MTILPDNLKCHPGVSRVFFFLSPVTHATRHKSQTRRNALRLYVTSSPLRPRSVLVLLDIIQNVAKSPDNS